MASPTMEQQSQSQGLPVHTIVVVAKCPIPGKSKTRLIPLLGQEGSSKLAKAMLSDVLSSLSECAALDTVRKILCYAPANQEGLGIMKTLLSELDLSKEWGLLPMTSPDLAATNLGDILTDILQRTRAINAEGKVIFLGMDAPELPLEEITGCLMKSSKDEALLCPANDGGYGMLAVPPQAPIDSVFQGIRWSNELTALGQLKVLTDNNIPVKLGRLMNDIDEPEDVTALCVRLGQVGPGGGVDESQAAKDDVLLKSSPFSGKARTGSCRHTRQILQELRLI